MQAAAINVDAGREEKEENERVLSLSLHPRNPPLKIKPIVRELSNICKVILIIVQTIFQRKSSENPSKKTRF